MTSENIFVNKYELNSKLEDKFMRIRTFSIEETQNIFDLNNTLYFDNYGNVRVLNSVGNEVLDYRNPTANKPLAANVGINKVDLERRKNPNTSKPYSLVFSPNIRWILYKVTYKASDFNPFSEEQIYDGEYAFLLFNFFHTAEFKDYYKANTTSAVNLFHDYCVATEGLDPLCSCTPANREICVARILPKDLIESQRNTSTYNSFSTVCQHIEKGCQNASSYPDSFLNQYYIDNPRPTTVNVTLCAMTFGAGGNLSINKAQISQQCSTSGDNSIGATITDGVKADGTSSNGRPSQVGTGTTVTGTTGPAGPNTTAAAQQNFLDKYLNYSEHKTVYNIIAVLFVLSILGGTVWYIWKKRDVPVVAPAPEITSPMK